MDGWKYWWWSWYVFMIMYLLIYCNGSECGRIESNIGTTHTEIERESESESESESQVCKHSSAVRADWCLLTLSRPTDSLSSPPSLPPAPSTPHGSSSHSRSHKHQKELTDLDTSRSNFQQRSFLCKAREKSFVSLPANWCRQSVSQSDRDYEKARFRRSKHNGNVPLSDHMVSFFTRSRTCSCYAVAVKELFSIFANNSKHKLVN